MIEDQLINITAILSKTQNEQIIKTLNEFKDAIQLILITQGNIKFVQKCLINVFNTVIVKIDQLSEQENNRSNQIILAFELEKIKKVTEMLPFMNKKSKNTIFNEDDYIQLLNIQIIQLDQQENTQQQLKNVYQKILLGHAYVNCGKQYQSIFVQHIVRNMKALYYLSNEQETNLAATKVITNPTIEHALQLWRIIDDSKIVKAGYKLQLEKIKFKKILYIPRLFNQITLDTLHNFNKNATDLPKNILYQMAFRQIKKKQNDYDIRLRIMCNKSIFKSKVYNQDIIQIIKELLQQELIINNTQYIQQIQQPSFFNNCCVSSRNEIREIGQNKIQNIIIHIHGGGFISMSSFSHQSYTRKWVNQLTDSVIFSIDYRLAPENPFPQALDDCWQYYMWIIHYSQAFFNIIPKNIILTGDSAGGNLAIGIIIRAIETNQRLPDKIVLQYPALNLNLFDVVPSNLNSMNDVMIPFGLLLICRTSYLQNQEDLQNDYYASPIKTPIDILTKFPKDFVIFIGQNDVLLDNSIEFIHLCQQNGLNSIKLKIFQDLPHGFQNLGMRNHGVLAAERANQQILEQIKQFLI